ncbi:MAG TPA: trigger factor [Cyclobacteriaceae bacterium]|nr:trigger factor [Cyclobacteriaceae bacterium]
MDITLDKQSTTDGLIKITLTESDYQPKVEEKVKEYSRKANIKGFRAGKVPSGVIKKMYGKSILVEEVNHLISHSVSDYIKDNNLRILGDPLPNQEKARTIDWDTQKSFEFEFQVGMVEDFQYELSPKVKLKSHSIEVDEAVIQETLTDMKQRFGNVAYPEVSGENDNLFGDVTGSDGEKKSSYIPIAKVEKKEQEKFLGRKKEDHVEFEIEKISPEPAVIARILNLPEQDAKDAKGKYTLTISTISHVEPAEVNQALFDKVFGNDVVKSEEEFLNKIKETISENYTRETEHLLNHEIEHFYVDHTTINMPDAFLKSWLKATSDGKVTDDVLEKEFNEYRNSLKWDLIKNKIAEDLKITVESEEVKNKAKLLIAEQFGGPAIADQLGDKLEAIADNYLAGQDGKGQNFMRLYNQLRQEKIMKAILSTATVTEKKVSLDEFKKIAAEHQH